jgi:hypothetical protein
MVKNMDSKQKRESVFKCFRKLDIVFIFQLQISEYIYYFYGNYIVISRKKKKTRKKIKR